MFSSNSEICKFEPAFAVSSYLQCMTTYFSAKNGQLETFLEAQIFLRSERRNTTTHDIINALLIPTHKAVSVVNNYIKHVLFYTDSSLASNP